MAVPPSTPPDTGTPDAHRGWHGSGLGTQVLVLTARSLRALRKNRQLIVFSLIQPLVSVTLFSQVFGSLTRLPGFPPGVSYLDFLLPAVLVTTAMSSGTASGSALIFDIKQGVVARFRSMPIHLASVLIARSLTNLIRTTLQLLITLLVATVLFGFRAAGGGSGVLGAILLALAISYGISWTFLAIGLWTADAETLQTITAIVLPPLTYSSSAYVPLAFLPGWMQALAAVNPVTYAVGGARGLTLGMPVTSTVLIALTTSAVIAVAAATLAIRDFGHAI